MFRRVCQSCGIRKAAALRRHAATGAATNAGGESSTPPPPRLTEQELAMLENAETRKFGYWRRAREASVGLGGGIAPPAGASSSSSRGGSESSAMAAGEGSGEKDVKNTRSGFFHEFRKLAEPESMEKQKKERPRYMEGVLNPIVSQDYLTREMIGTWRDNRKLEDFLSQGDIEKFMTIKEAAKRLKIEDAELAKLTSARIEEEWAKRYEAAGSNAGEKLELSAAAEVLLSYLETNTHEAVLAAHNRKVMNDFKQEMALRKKKELDERYGMMMWGLGGALLSVGVLLMAAIYVIAWTRNKDLTDAIWRDVDDRLCIIQGRVPGTGNAGPVPDYQTRYKNTKTSLEEYWEGKGVTHGALDPQHQSILETKAEHDSTEERLIVQIFNEVTEDAKTQEKEDRLTESRVRVVRREDLDNISSEPKEIVLKNGLVLSPMRGFTWQSFKDYCWSMALLTMEIKTNALNAARKS